MQKTDFFSRAVPSAIASGHPWPLYAVCEAALESAWGESELAKVANNLFGQKSGFSTEGLPTIEIQTREVLNGTTCIVPATWPKFPDWAASFKARFALLQRSTLYAPALSASTGDDFIRLVSEHWSTDPQRAIKVLETYHCNWLQLLNASVMAHKAATE
jgi:flagellum-specific peptidoglycan hydrolase FlgJ